MEQTLEETLKELEKWSDIYDIFTHISDNEISISVDKQGVELFGTQLESTAECYKEALKYIERINPKSKKETVVVGGEYVDIEPIEVDCFTMNRMIHSVFSKPSEYGRIDNTKCVEVEINISGALLNEYLGACQDVKYNGGGFFKERPFLSFKAPNTTNALRLMITEVNTTADFNNISDGDVVRVKLINYTMHPTQNFFHSMNDMITFR